MLAEAGVGILGIEGIDQERVAPFNESARRGMIENGRRSHLAGDPAFRDRAKERFVGCDHEMTL
jgi:hypothetical protein